MNHLREKQDEDIHANAVDGTSLIQNLSVLTNEMRPYVKAVSCVHFDKDMWFETMLTSSLVRNFQFLDLVTSEQGANSFYLIPALRGITEDIIYLQFLSRLDLSDRNEFLRIKARQGFSQKVKCQHDFFSAFRPFQPVIRLQDEADVQETNERVKSFWKTHIGLERPSTRRIAEKCGQELLAIIYDFIYRLTSATVHFDLNWAMKLGWGDLESGSFEFDTKHFETYFSAINCIYGAYLLCIFFELFRSHIKMDNAANDVIERVRKLIIEESRWPELVTFEEMNIQVPKLPQIPTMILYALYMTSHPEKGFIAASRDILSRRLDSEFTPHR